MANERTNVVDIRAYLAKKPALAERAERPAAIAVRDEPETPATVTPLNGGHAARVLERLLQEWEVARLDEFSQLHGDKTTKLVERIIRIYSAFPSCIEYIAAKSGELLYILDALYEGYCGDREE